MSQRAYPPGRIVVDLQALQSPATRGRGIARYTLNWATTLEALRPDLVHRYLLNPALNPPESLAPLLDSGKVTYSADEAFAAHVELLHLCSPLDLELRVATLWPRVVQDRQLRMSATIYDLIPALDIEHELIRAIDRERYRTRLELVRALDHVHVISSSVGRDVERVLGIAPERIARVGAAPSANFQPPVSQTTADEAAARVLGTSLDFVLYPSGSHPRKNNELLIDAWLQCSPEIRAHFALVITGNLPESTQHHLRMLAQRDGRTAHVIVTGEVDDVALVSLYQAAQLVCFPSKSEGYGLPVAEAIACGTPVIGSDRPPLDELLDASARFDPDDKVAVAAAITAALTDPTRKKALSSQSVAQLHSWSDVAHASAHAFEATVTKQRTRHSPRSTPVRIAFATPLPPAPTGVAAYSFQLIEALMATGRCVVDVFVDGPTQDVVAPVGVSVYHVHSLPTIERIRGGYDHVVYTVGNSHHHLGALRMLRERPGVVIAHDVRLTNLYRHLHGDPGLLLGGFQRALHAMYDAPLPEDLGNDGIVTDADIKRHGTYMAREAIRCSEKFLVSSDAAAALARIDSDARYAHRVATLPFAMTTPRDIAPTPSKGVTPDEVVGKQVLVVAHFGIVDPSKHPAECIAAFVAVHAALPNAALVFVGPISAALREELSSVAAACGVQDAIFMTGDVPIDVYAQWLQRAQIAVQLRRTFNGEASAAIGECLASGVPTIVSDIGWSHELPDTAVVKVASPLDTATLAHAISGLLHDAQQRKALSRSAQDFAMQHTFQRTALVLLDLLDRKVLDHTADQQLAL